jgi:hypothetical protein
MNTIELRRCPNPPATPRAAGDSAAATALGRGAGPRALYLVALTWAFTVFNSVRVFSYLPTLWAIQRSGDSSQHSLITWLTWLGANVTMSLWLYEHNQRRCNKAILVNAGNAAKCLVTSLLIAWHRF